MKASAEKSSSTVSRTTASRPFFAKAGGGDFFAPVNRAAVPAVQAKMTVGKTGDKFEREADKMAMSPYMAFPTNIGATTFRNFPSAASSEAQYTFSSADQSEHSVDRPQARIRPVDDSLKTDEKAQATGQPAYAQSVELESEKSEKGGEASTEMTPPAAAKGTVSVNNEEVIETDQKEGEVKSAEATDETIGILKKITPETEEQKGDEAEESKKEKDVTPEESKSAEAAASGKAGGVGEVGDGTARVNESINGLMQFLTETAGLAFRQVQFTPCSKEKSDNSRIALQTVQNRVASEALGTAFLARNVNHVQNLIELGITSPSRIMAVATEAKAMIDTTVASNLSAVRGTIAVMRERANADAAHAIEKINVGRDKAQETIHTASTTASKAVETAHIDSKTTLDTLENEQITSIEALYQEWDPKYRAVGDEVGNTAMATARSKADNWLNQRNGESSVLDGPIHDNRLEAKADAAVNVAQEYKKGLKTEADKQADKLTDNKPQVLDAIRNASQEGRSAFDQHLETMKQALQQSEEAAITQIQTKADSLITATGRSLQTTLSSLGEQRAAQEARLTSYGESQKMAIDAQAAEAITSLLTGINDAATGFNGALRDFLETAISTKPPNRQDLEPILTELQVQADTLALTLQTQLENGIAASETGVHTGGQTSVDRVNKLGQSAVEQARSTGDQYATSTSAMVAQAQSGFTRLASGHQKTVDDAKTKATEGFAETREAITTTFKAITDRAKSNFKDGRDQLKQGLEREGLKNLDNDIQTTAQQAADAVQPRWKKVAKWAITIAVVIASVALTIVTAGGAGPIGVVLIGAAIGGLAGATIQMGHNLVDGKKWSDGVGTAFVVGAIGGAFGGLGGVLSQGVANVGLKLGIEVGIDVVGGVLGDLAVGNPITVEGILFGAAIGAGIGGGLALGSALKGKIKIRPRPAVDAPTVRPDVVTPPALKPSAPEVSTPRPKAPEAPSVPKSTPDVSAPKPVADTPVPKAPKPVEAPSPKVPESAPPLKRPGPEPAPSPKQKGHPDRPEVEDGIVAKQKTADGHEMKVTKDGDILKCSECKLADAPSNSKAKQDLEEAKALQNPDAKAKKAAEIDAELSSKKDPEVNVKADTDPEVKTKKATNEDTETKAKTEPTDKSPEGKTTAGPDNIKKTPKPGEPGSPEHKAQRWAEYQERTGGKGWDYDRWSKTYENNMQQAKLSHKAVDAYREKLGWGKREVTIDIDGTSRRLDIADVATRRGVEHKRGYMSRTKEILSELTRDANLVKKGWMVEWAFEGTASKPLQDALKDVGIYVKFI